MRDVSGEVKKTSGSHTSQKKKKKKQEKRLYLNFGKYKKN